MVLAWQKLMFLLTYGMVHMMPHSNALDNFIAKKSASGVMWYINSRRSQILDFLLSSWLMNIYTYRKLCSQIESFCDSPEVGRFDLFFM